MMRVDAHHHLWRYTAEEFGWLEGDLAGLRRDFLRDDLLAAMQSAGVDAAVAVQARQSVAETEFLLATARETPQIAGVVGWLPLREDGLPELLERYTADETLRGLRHVVQGEPDGFMDGAVFNRGVAALAGAGLVYDVLILERQLEEAIRLVDRHPGQQFVLDHVAKPRIAAGEMEPWASRVRALAERPNVCCKVSGMVTEADPKAWTSDQLQPYLDVVLEAFTPARLMVGTDWPVLLAGCGYAQWWKLLEVWAAALSESERADLFGGTAIRIYGLQL